MSAWRNRTRMQAGHARDSRRITVVLTTLSTFLIALVLLFQFRAREPSQSTPWNAGDTNTLDDGKTLVAQQSDNILHPQDHIYRDAQTWKHHFRITAGDRRPDGVLKRVYMVNNAFPGPTIEARSGDRLVIVVENALDNEPVSLHWHGLSMRGANAMDGASGITQAPIMPGSNFTYDFQVEETQHGTFWYHAHEGVQRADGLYGGLVIHDPGRNTSHREELDTEELLMIGDWYHQTAKEALAKYMHPGAFGMETVPDSMLVNGNGVFNCSNAVAARPVDCINKDQQNNGAVALDRTRGNIVRVINVGAYAGFSIRLDVAPLTAVAVDGGHRISSRPSWEVGVLHPGERVDVRVESGSEITTEITYLTVSLDETPFKYQNLALTSVQAFPIRWLGVSEEGARHHEKPEDVFDIQSAVSLNDQSGTLPSIADQTLVLYAITQKLAHLENEPHGFINQTTWKPLGPSPLLGLARDRWGSDQLVPKIDYEDDLAAQWVDVVVNNLDEEGHPFHLHGHDFWVLSTHTSTFNWGSYNPFSDAEPPGGTFDLTRPLRKDTVYVPRRGYAVLRFKADNPGLWMFHCHVLWHLASGMAMAFEID